MKKMASEIEEFLAHQTIEFEWLCSDQRNAIEKNWLRTYAVNVKKQTGSWIHIRFKWHGFSYGYERAIEGDRALRKYRDNWSAPFFVFDEEIKWGFRCVSESYPDFSKFGADIYVCHHNTKWTMVFTHEQPNPGAIFHCA